MTINEVKFHRFKQFKSQRIPISGQPITLIAGGNNAGKSSVLHGLAIWEFCRTVLRAERDESAFYKSEASQRRQGMGMGEDEFSPIAIPSLNHLWTNLRSQKEEEPDGYTLQIGLSWSNDSNENSLQFALSLANDRLFLRVNESTVGPDDPIPTIAYLPPFAGIMDREARVPGAIRRRRIGEGLAGAVLRNLLLDMFNDNASKRQELRGDRAKILDSDLRDLRQTDGWELLQSALRSTFGAELQISDFNEEYHSYIRVNVLKGTTEGYRLKRHQGYNKRDIMVEGSGFLQWLSVYALATNPNVDLLLLDEPDAHLHVSLQRELFGELERLARATSKQVIVATHSAEMLRDAEPSSILEMHSEGPRFLTDNSSKIGLLAGLGSDYSPRIDQVRRTKRILFVEGEIDADILRVFAEVLGIDGFDDWVVWKWPRNRKGRRQLYLALEQEIGDLTAVSLVDRDTDHLSIVGEGLEDKSAHSEESFLCRVWRRRNIESYLLWPPAIALATNLAADVVEAQLAEQFGLAMPADFRSAMCPQPWLDADGKSIFFGLLGSLQNGQEIGQTEVAAAFRPEEICEDVDTLLRELCGLA